MSLINIKKHKRNISIFKAYSFKQLLKEGFLFPIDYGFRKGKSQLPLNIALFLTLRCNARCKMCNLTELLNNEKYKKEISLTEIENFIKQVAPRKPSIILFGGEPFLRNDFLDVLKIIKKYKLPCGVFTNGLLLNEELIKNLVESGLDYIVFSLQGSKTIHDNIVGIEGAYDKLVKNLKIFCELKNKTKVIIHTTISEDNIDDLDKIVELGKSINVDLIRFGHPTFFTKEDIIRNKIFCSNYFSDENIEEISWHYDPSNLTNKYIENINSLKKKYGNSINFTPDLNEDEIKSWYSKDFKTSRKCLFAWRALFVYPNGDVYPCESIKYKMGNILEKDFKSIWNNDKYVKFRKLLKKGLFPACARCCKL